MTSVVRQAGAVVFRRLQAPEFLLVRARRTPGQWIFPKGHIEPGESAAEAALREAREEAGVVGRLVAPLEPAITFTFGANVIHVEYFLVEAAGAVEEYEPREQAWLSADAALARLTHADARTLLKAGLSIVVGLTGRSS